MAKYFRVNRQLNRQAHYERVVIYSMDVINTDSEVVWVPCKPGIHVNSGRVFPVQCLLDSTQVVSGQCFVWSPHGLCILGPVLQGVNLLLIAHRIIFKGRDQKVMDGHKGLVCDDSLLSAPSAPDYRELADFWRRLFGETSVRSILKFCASRLKSERYLGYAACLFCVQNPGPENVDLSLYDPVVEESWWSQWRGQLQSFVFAGTGCATVQQQNMPMILSPKYTMPDRVRLFAHPAREQIPVLICVRQQMQDRLHRIYRGYCLNIVRLSGINKKIGKESDDLLHAHFGKMLADFL